MRIGMLIIGSELLQGKQLEANLHFLGGFLRTYHQEVTAAQIVSDKKSLIQEALKSLYQNVDLVVVCGRLGPTPDDITKSELADFFKKPIGYSQIAEQVARENYQRMGKVYPDQHTYSQLPEGFTPLSNNAGFAPGLWFQDGIHTLIALPGVPREFRQMLEDHLPRLVQLQNTQKLNLVTVRTKGIPEEKIFQDLCPGLWSELEKFGEVSSLPQLMGVDVGVKTTTSPETIYQIIAQTALAPYVWSYGMKSLEETIIELAAEKKMTFGFAESCTAGLCAHRITNVSGASQVFWGSVVSYDNTVKKNLLKVKPQTLLDPGAVSPECATEMALGARAVLGVDVAISLTGIAGPGGGSIQKPVGTVCIAVATSVGHQTKILNFKGDRENLKLRFSQAGLYLLWETLSEVTRT